MIQVFHTNQPTRHVEQLCAQVSAARMLDPRGPFARALVVVPDQRTGAWLKLQIAAQHGSMTNFEITTLEDYVATLLDLPHLADRRTLRARFESVLRDRELLERPEMAATLRYLGGVERLDAASHDDAERDLLERRRFQLSAQLSEIFEHYMYSRPQVLAAWEEDHLLYQESSAQQVELWQRALWRAAIAKHGTLYTPSHAASLVRAGDRRVRARLDKIIHVFHPHSTLRAHYDLFDALGTQSILFCYLYNPCAEFWHDLRFGRMLARQEAQLPVPGASGEAGDQATFSSAGVYGGSLDYQGDDSFWSDSEQIPFLLRSWGHAGGLHLRTFEVLPGADRLDLFDEPEAPTPERTLLHQIQQDILHMRRTPLPAGSALFEQRRDRSLQILAASNIRREVEVIASEIWRLIDEDQAAARPGSKLLRLNQIAVLLPEQDREVYQTHIRSIFPATRQLPFNMVDMPAKNWSRAMEAVHMLLALPFGQFRRHELLRLLTHPNLIGQFPNLDPEEWLQWCDDLKILHGADRRDHADTYIKGELFHWDQGLRRLCLGAFMTGKAAQDRRVFSIGHSQHYLPYEYGQSQLVSAGRLVLMARSLIEDARFCRTARMPLHVWADFFCRLLSTYLVQHEPEDELLLHTCRQLMASMADYDLTKEPVSYRVAYENAIELLADVEVRKGQFLLDGVVVMGMEPGRALPFEAIFVAGMNEGAFPRTTPKRPEDLRFATNELGETIIPIDGKLMASSSIIEAHERDHDQYTFLSTLMNAQKHLCVSYVSHDARTGEERQPSSLIHEILYAVELDYLDDDAPDEEIHARTHRVERALVHHHAARRFHERYFEHVLSPDHATHAAANHDRERPPEVTPSAQPEALEEASTLALRHDLEEHCARHAIAYPSRETLQATARRDVWEQIKQKLGLCTPPEDDQIVQQDNVLRLSTYDIRSFLECPLQGSARFLLRLDEDNLEEILLKESELFEPTGRANAMLLRNVFLEKLAREHKESKPFEFKDFYDDHARYFELEGLLPTGPFLRAARERHLKLLERWQENLPLLGAGRSPPMEVRRFGRPIEQDYIDVANPPLSLDMLVGPGRDKVRVEISGRTEVFIPDWPATVIPNQSTNAWRISPKYFLRGFLDQVFLSAAGEHTDKPWTVLLNPAEEAVRYKHKNCIRQFKPLDTQTSRQYLRDVIQDMLTQVHAYYMPVEVVFEHVQGEESVAHIAEQKRQSSWAVTSSDHGPIHDPNRYPAPEDAQKIIARRYGLYFEQLKGKH